MMWETEGKRQAHSLLSRKPTEQGLNTQDPEIMT